MWRFFLDITLLMIVNNLSFERITISPNETNAVLIVYADAVLAFPITSELRDDCSERLSDLVVGEPRVTA